MRGIVRMPGPQRAPHVIPAPGIRVGNQDGNGRSGRLSLKHAADNLKRVRLAARRSGPPGRTAQIQLMPDQVFIHRNSGSHAIQHGADFRSVALAEQCHADTAAKGVFHIDLRVPHRLQVPVHLFCPAVSGTSVSSANPVIFPCQGKYSPSVFQAVSALPDKAAAPVCRS